MEPSQRLDQPLPVLPKVPGEVILDGPWNEQKQHAIQVLVACQIYFGDFGGFPAVLTDAMEIMNHDLKEQNRMKRHFQFTDPADGKMSPWNYFPNAEEGSDDVLISSPESKEGLRVFCLASGVGGILTEEGYLKIINK